MKDSKNNKNKKGIIILGGLSLLAVLGGTLAYFTTTTNIANKFKSGMYQNEIVEKFESPVNWTPGTVTEKKISVKNTGNIPMAVRASYTEKWVSASGKELNLAPIVIDEIESGAKREVSAGYECEYVERGGKYYQTNIRGNHVALVQQGRAGKTVCIKDEQPKETTTHAKRLLRKAKRII